MRHMSRNSRSNEQHGESQEWTNGPQSEWPTVNLCGRRRWNDWVRCGLDIRSVHCGVAMKGCVCTPEGRISRGEPTMSSCRPQS
ncbi:hypothetical protein (plasmid) [Streptomyces leeuwenhoekii]|uniref:Uncharacterized protein n=1 Tax=Streptomyces leeuwenhoekii TaxID=1437453 RepID=A0A0F7VKL4_STRLW|nr:hypothetical protein [Streptomyces leeuwenhoekii]